ncbi:MAG: cation-transporting P-type ATPase, partial [Gammaproteobacteria bacterium]
MTEQLEQTTVWHHYTQAQTLESLGVDAQGLSEAQATQRRKEYGPNILRPPQGKNLLQRFLLQFHNIFIYVLLGAALMTALLAHWIDTGVILGVVFINALIGIIQEGKAEKALDAIRNLLTPQAMVRRDHQTRTLAAEQLVPGDIVYLQSGDKVPADLRLIHVKDLRIDESLLTGESVAVEKAAASVAEDTPLAERSSMAFTSTLVTYGQATGVVVSTGEQTEIGRISRMLGEVNTLTTPMLQQVAHFARGLTLVILVVSGLTFAFGMLIQGFTAADMLLATVGLAVAAIPEGLPAIMTITLAIGVQNMARSKAIVRRLPAVETLGSVSIICSDKTGTLTRNEMTVRAVATVSERFEVSGSGYDPHGVFSLQDNAIDVDDYPLLQELTRAALLCNDANLHRQEGDWKLNGDPTEGALVALGMKAGHEPGFVHEEWQRTDIIPFESEHRFMATLHHDHSGHALIYLKGAPEKVLDMCDTQHSTDEDQALDKTYWHEQMEVMAEQGLRLLAIARKTVPAEQHELRFADVEDGLSLLGIVGMMDPPRDEAIEAVAQCHAAGIRVIMITGDHLITARSIGLTMGIGDGTHAISGQELDDLDDAQLERAIAEVDVFARTTPGHKLRLVTALQAAGQVVAMTGDGVNDAPALKRADVGMAMGKKGTEVAKEAAEMVLADDNFATIATAVAQGRAVYDNLKKSILFIMPTSGGEALSILAAIAFGSMLPITPVQILWINMVTAVTLGLTLAFEPAEQDVMQRKPRRPTEPLFSRLIIWRIIFVSLILVSGTYGLFVWYREAGASLELARTVAVNTLVMFEIFYLFNARHFFASAMSV